MCQGDLHLPKLEGQSVKTGNELGRSGKTVSTPRKKSSDTRRLANAPSTQLTLKHWFDFHRRGPFSAAVMVLYSQASSLNINIRVQIPIMRGGCSAG